MKIYIFSCKKNTENEKINKTDWCFYQIVLFVARKNGLLLIIKDLIMFQMISLK